MPKSTIPKSSAPKPAVAKGPELLVVFLLVVLTTASFWPVLSCGFISLDDPDYVTRNAHVHAGLTLDGVAWAFTTGHAANWHPLTWLSLMLDHQLFNPDPSRADDPRGYHAVNLGLHIANVVLVFLIFKRMTGPLGRGALARSALVAALFAVHPLRAESVAWVAERKDVLSAFFGLATILAYTSWVRTPGQKRFALVLLLYALSLMAKPMLVTLPLLLLLLDYWPLGRMSQFQPSLLPSAGEGQGVRGRPARTGTAQKGIPLPLPLRSLVYEKIPLAVLAAASCAVTVIVQSQGRSMQSLEAFPWSDRLGNALVSYGRYLGKMVRVDELAFFYPHPGEWPLWQVIGCGVFLAASVAFVIWRLRPNPWLAVGWFWYLGLLVPVIGLVQVGMQSMADRYTYLPSIGVLLLLVWSLPQRIFEARTGRVVLGLASAGALAVFSLSTWRQCGIWKDSQTVYAHAIDVTAGNYLAHEVLGHVLAEQRNDPKALERAFDHYTISLRLKPNNAFAYLHRGNLYQKMGNYRRALADYNRAVRIGPQFGVCYDARALLLATAPDDQGRNGPQALEDARRACEITRWRRPEMIATLAAAYAATGNFAQALHWQEEAIQLGADRPAFLHEAHARLQHYRRGQPLRAE